MSRTRLAGSRVAPEYYLTTTLRLNVMPHNGMWHVVEETWSGGKWTFHRFETDAPPKVTEGSARAIVGHYAERWRYRHDLRLKWLASFKDVPYPDELHEIFKDTEVWPKRLPDDWYFELMRVEVPNVGKVLAIEWLRQDGLRAATGVDTEEDGKRWLHVSCRFRHHLPTWEDLSQVKELFIGNDKKAIQVLPPVAEYVNISHYSLHLFHCLDGDTLPSFTRSVRGKE